MTEEGEKAVDLVDPEDYKTMAALLNTEESKEKERRMSMVKGAKKEPPAWFRRESIRRESAVEMPKLSMTMRSDERKIGMRFTAMNISDKETFSEMRGRKGSMWVGGDESKVLEEEETLEDSSSDIHAEETEEAVSAKLEQWKQRRIKRLER